MASFLSAGYARVTTTCSCSAAGQRERCHRLVRGLVQRRACACPPSFRVPMRAMRSNMDFVQGPPPRSTLRGQPEALQRASTRPNAGNAVRIRPG